MGGHVDYRYDWTEMEESSITGPDLIRDTSEKGELDTTTSSQGSEPAEELC